MSMTAGVFNLVDTHSRSIQVGALSPTHACPAVCKCGSTWEVWHEGYTVDCSYKELTSVPDGIPAHTATLNLDDNQLNSIQSDSFTSLNNLQWLSLYNNQLTSIPSD